eukprot:TRINITY_DN22754_c0_g1_i3.p1 TRINITY_DN22754_c0_g1~~TRINITY_DN22754_c0_g1_i3.p1  ORF type:complete len:201 (+),score=69.73 TRINITY_DN22754_c0_g1_i3:143-745(+)
MCIRDRFDKTLALKYTDVVEVVYENIEEEQDVPAYDPHGMAASRMSNSSMMMNNTTSMVHNGSGVNDSGMSQLSPIRSVTNNGTSGATALRVENEVLSSRVTIISSELGECRELIEELRLQLSRTTESLRASQQLNAYLLAGAKNTEDANASEVKKSEAASTPAPSKTRERLIARLAAEEHRDVEAAMGAIDEDSDIEPL